MKTLLWLDDYRDPETHAPNYNDYSNITWVKNYIDFCEHLDKNGLPSVVSFDHDLGLSFIEIFSGYDCAKYLVEYCIDRRLQLPEFYVHSQNPAGRENILSILNNYKKHYESKHS